MHERTRSRWLGIYLRLLAVGFLTAFIPWIALILLNAPILAPGSTLAPLLRFQPYNAALETMMAAVHIVWAVMLWRAASNPAQHTLFIDFTIWANAAHGVVMVIATPLQKSLVMTFIEGVPLFAIAAMLWWLRPRPGHAVIAREVNMEEYTPNFAVSVRGVKGSCPAGEKYAKEQLAAKTIPVLSCEGPCIRGEIARLAANMISQDVPELARACHAETFFVPHSSMASWIKRSNKTIMIDGCFLKCHGRVLKELVPEDRVIHIDALPLYNKYNNVFLMDDVPETERKVVARQVADKIIGKLHQAGHIPARA